MTNHGRAARPVWIDGIRFEKTTDARKALKVCSEVENRSFMAAKFRGGYYKGHYVSEAPGFSDPEFQEVKIEPSKPRALLPGLTTHRLGAYVGGRW